MPKGYRLYRAALGGILAAFFLSGVLSAQQQPEASSRPAQSQQQTNPAPDPSSLRAIFNEAVEIFAREKAAGADAEQRKEDREKSDLAAQWEQSWWAQVAAVAACIALFVNAVTLLYLRSTLHQTRRTADAAVDAARAARDSIAESARAALAAEKAVAVAQETAQRQLRAYLCVHTVDLLPLTVGKPPEAYVKLINAGQTPANKVNVILTFAKVALPQDKRLVHASGPTSGALVTVGPGIELELKDLRMDDGLTEEDLLNLRNQQLALVVFGRAQYVDAFGRDQTTNFKFQTLVEECAKGIIKLSPSVDGNDAT